MRLNVGSGPAIAADWINLDGSWQAGLAGRPWLSAVATRMFGTEVGHWPAGVRYRDVRRGLEYSDASVATVYASHVLEHLHREDAVRFLREARRVLRPGGVCRVVVPDVLAIVGWYLAHRQEPAEGRSESSSDLLMGLLGLRSRSPRRGLSGLVRGSALHEHKWMYDAEGLLALFAEAGFETASPRRYLESAIPRTLLEQVEHADRICHGAGVCVEGLV